MTNLGWCYKECIGSLRWLSITIHDSWSKKKEHSRLGPVVALIETLVAAGDGNALVTSQKPTEGPNKQVRNI